MVEARYRNVEIRGGLIYVIVQHMMGLLRYIFFGKASIEFYISYFREVKTTTAAKYLVGNHYTIIIIIPVTSPDDTLFGFRSTGRQGNGHRDTPMFNEIEYQQEFDLINYIIFCGHKTKIGTNVSYDDDYIYLTFPVRRNRSYWSSILLY